MSQIILSDMSYSYKKYYGPIFENVNVNIDTNWKLGLIGRNGRGKTTLLKLIHNELTPDQGKIIKSIDTELFPYENKVNYTNTLDVLKENIAGLRTMEDNLEDLTILQQYLDYDGFEMEGRIKKELYRMHLSEDLLERDFELLSGGEKTKLLLIALFLRKNSFILLDEPTNHLDTEGKQTIADYLSKKKGFIVVSHDREFLDKVIDHVISINKADISIEKGNYTSWRNNKDRRDETERRTRDRLEGDIISLEHKAATSRDWGRKANKEKYEFASHARTNGSRAFMRQAKNAEKMIKDNIEVKKSLLLNFEKAKELEIKQEDTEKVCLVIANNIRFGYTDKVLLQDVSFKIYPGDRLWIRGNNGAGKSTLLKLISQRIPNQYMEYKDGLLISESYQDPIWEQGFLYELYQETNRYDMEAFDRFQILCETFDLPQDYLERPIETYSSGEKKKVDIARALSMNNHILFLDEPLNFMDIYFREQLEKAILQYNSTLVFVEHDVRFGNNIANSMIYI